ncbi:cyclic pyranopterin monophosphate synthase [Plasmodiophora brassicae]|uniref:cyclic pyranopterin monophosphate synthase n=1 Tax=Plasmodiophora brassicae TaxID=37360 RepID=A0A0G4IK33_PLABS|nr:hypothetical protein PBRA_004196 [Plasmodiophora brassicae]SPR00345.1 unnamed protein product [Plasmodiophora brassicae]
MQSPAYGSLMQRLGSSAGMWRGVRRDVSGWRWASSTLSHIDAARHQPAMVSIGGKVATERSATAACVVRLPDPLSKLLFDDPSEIHTRKGPVFTTAIVAGTMAVKRTSDLLPFCHPLPIECIRITIEPSSDRSELHVQCSVDAVYKTGVEMEALTGASITALCIYDMCKSVSLGITIDDTRLVCKSGGKSSLRTTT